MAKFEDEIRAHLNAAKGYAELSYGKRLKVGAVLVKDGRPIAAGRNGMPSGGSNVLEERVQEGPYSELVTKREVVHAETNVIAFAAAADGVSTKGCIMVITHSPCFECCKLIVQSKIKAVYYETEYRILDGLKYLNNNNVITEKIDGRQEKSRAT